MRTDVVCFLLALAGTAHAAPTRKVRIATEPAGATVYLSSKENGPVCPATPCTFDAPIGDTPIIIELENHVSLVENLSIPKRDRKPLDVSFKLVAAVGTIKVEGPKGAKITINDEDRGTAPTEIEIEAGQYIVMLSMNGKPLESHPVDVEAGGEVTVVGAGKAAPQGEPTTGGIGAQVEVKPPRQGTIVSASATFEIGFRAFSYDNVQTTATLNDESEPGVVTAGPHVELWLGNLFRVPALRGVSLLGRAQFGLNKLTIAGEPLMAPATTFWQSLEISARHRWTIKQRGTVEVGAGFVRDRFQFNGDVDDVRLLPDVDYKSIRIGGRGSLLFGAWEPYLVAENRIVLSGGALERRFDSATTSGLRGALGLAAKFGKLHARLEGSLMRYRWTFKYENDDAFKADAGTDSIKLVALSVGYAL